MQRRELLQGLLKRDGLARFLLRNLLCGGGCYRCYIDADERLIWCLRGQMRHDLFLSLGDKEWSGWPLSVLMKRGQRHMIRFGLGHADNGRDSQNFAIGAANPKNNLYHPGAQSLFYEHDKCG
jgi:hypothetical protein